MDIRFHFLGEETCGWSFWRPLGRCRPTCPMKAIALIVTLALGLLLVACATTTTPAGQTAIPLPSPPVGPLSEQVVRIPLRLPGMLGETQLLLEATLYRPEGPGPFPLVVISHGSPRDPARRQRVERFRFEAQSRAFLTRGFAVVIPMRRGYGGSEGAFAEDIGRCKDADFLTAGLESAKDVLAAVRFMQAQPFVDAQRVLLVGVSAGGFASLALASQGVEGLVGVINFAGGRGSRAARQNCWPERLVQERGRFGRTTRVPTLWIYAENDS